MSRIIYVCEYCNHAIPGAAKLVKENEKLRKITEAVRRHIVQLDATGSADFTDVEQTLTAAEREPRE